MLQKLLYELRVLNSKTPLCNMQSIDSKQNHHIRFNCSAMVDILWWHLFISTWNGIMGHGCRGSRFSCHRAPGVVELTGRKHISTFWGIACPYKTGVLTVNSTPKHKKQWTMSITNPYKYIDYYVYTFFKHSVNRGDKDDRQVKKEMHYF